MNWCKSTNKINKRGVTFSELLVTLALIMLIAGLGMQVVISSARWFVRAEVEHLRALILYLQRKARLEKRQQVLKLDIYTHSYSYNNTRYIFSHGIVFDVPPIALREQTKQARKISTFKHNSIYFYPDGTISAGTVYIADKRYSRFYALTCGVGYISYIRMYYYTHNAWTLLHHTPVLANITKLIKA